MILTMIEPVICRTIRGPSGLSAAAMVAISAPHRATRGKVVALDPFGVLAKRGVKVPVVGFNPMAALDPNDPLFVDDAMALAEALFLTNYPTAR